MTQEDKQLLLLDLSARYPYGVLIETGITPRKLFPMDLVCDELPRPYLRPMSSMTDEEKEIYKRFCDEDMRQLTYVQEVHTSLKQKTSCHRSIDWLNRKGFDYRGLIPMGLALEAPEGMYKS